MQLFQDRLAVETAGAALHEVTDRVTGWVARQPVRDGLLSLFVQHTSASLVIQENADPDVRRDLEEFFRRLVPEGAGWMRHIAEGPDDMPSHIRSALTQTQLTIPVMAGRLGLGTWQGIFLFEHRRAPHRRTIILSLLGA